MSDYDHVTDPVQLRKLIKTKELRPSELSQKQKEALYGKGNQNTVRYRQAERDGKKVIVSRQFAPGEKIPEGWVDTPLKCGLKKKPSRRQSGEDRVAYTLPDEPAEGSGPQGEPDSGKVDNSAGKPGTGKK